MLDARFVRENPEKVAQAMKNRHFPWDPSAFVKLDEQRRSAITAEEKIQAKRNELSKQIGQLLRDGKKDEAEAVKAEVSNLKDDLAKASSDRETADGALHDLLMSVPNIPVDSTPIGKDDTENPEVRRWGEPRTFDFDFKAHWDLGADLNIIDFDRSTKLAGSRFVLLGGVGARLERSLINFMVDTHTSRGFKEWWTPYLVNKATMTGTGQLPKFEEQLFKTRDEHLYLIPTAEVPLTNIHAGDVLDGDQLPLRYTAFTPCFREEAGAAGRDTRGIIRVHQFDKVEMVKFCKPEDGWDELESLTNEAEYILQQLKLPYHVVNLCTGDLGFSAAKCYDLEVWLPSYNDYKEISSCSCCTDFQARRANIKYRDPKAFKGTRYVYTLNGSGLAVGRTMAAILENYQNEDGTVTVPDVLRPYMGCDTITPESSPVA